MKAKNVLIVGTTGLVGSELLNCLLADNEIASVLSWGRKDLGFKHPKLTDEQVDFDQLPSLVRPIDTIYCTLGTTIKTAGSKEAFDKIDRVYPLEVAKKGLEAGAKSMALLTAAGADQDAMVFYSKVKGKLEKQIKEMPFEYIQIFHPSMLLGNRDEKRTLEAIGQKVMSFFSFLIPDKYKAIEAKTVAKAMLHYTKSPKKGLSVIENDQMLATPT